MGAPIEVVKRDSSAGFAPLIDRQSVPLEASMSYNEVPTNQGIALLPDCVCGKETGRMGG